MEERIRERYGDRILTQAMYRYAIAPESIALLDGFESYMYEFSRDDGDYILRVGHSLRRSENLILGEVDWINYLVRGGTPAAGAILSESGSLVEPIADGQGGQFLACAFEKAKGKPPWEVGWNDQRWQSYGQMIGRMHALTKEYQPASPEWVRPQWDDPLMLDIENNVPPEQQVVLERFRALIAQLKSLPRGHQSFGLIHFDAHEGNMFMDETGNLTLFDFDDCLYGWFIYDIAIVLFYKAMGANANPEFINAFMGQFLRGYRQENSLDPAWLVQIPHFLKLREVDLYGVIHRSFDVENLDDPWCLRYMDGRRERIEEGIPYLDCDWESLAVYL